MAGRPIVHVEFPVKDPQEASKFYSELFGWELMTFPGTGYVMFQVQGGPTGAFVPEGPAAPGSPFKYKAGELLAYIASDDIEADLPKIEAKGGKIVLPKTEIPNTGWYGIFRDTSGNLVALFTPSGQQQ